MLYISLLSPTGKGREAIDYLKKLKAPRGIKIHDTYLTLGGYDGVIIFEAPDANAALNFAVETGIATDYVVDTLTAIPAKGISLARKGRQKRAG